MQKGANQEWVEGIEGLKIAVKKWARIRFFFRKTKSFPNLAPSLGRGNQFRFGFPPLYGGGNIFPSSFHYFKLMMTGFLQQSGDNHESAQNKLEKALKDKAQDCNPYRSKEQTRVLARNCSVKHKGSRE
ncbi:hypothetical protein CEXT_629011 [Caerostris extrusa]|uniref:Uncharacterized protein n=1 Tax=Caerostris extrusa TaxID=172846 RepID=A0AAV4P3U3_CAEEX|nr:hypothetical protein CEXT_629011 [Caerostris extrusa]